MEIYTEEFWEILPDVIALCLCGFVILCLRKGLMGQGRPWVRSFFGYRGASRSGNKSSTKNMAKDNENVLKEGANGHFGKLSVVLAQLMRQSEMAFALISDTIRIEREVLQELIEKRKANNGTDYLSTEKPGQVKEHRQNKNVRDLRAPDLDNDQYGEVVRLADLGVGVDEIYDRVRIPKGEIELIIKLNKKGFAYHRKGQATAQAFA
jgi:hypothetical protein